MSINQKISVHLIYTRLCEVKTVNKVEEPRRFDIDERSIQRDIDDIRAFIEERRGVTGDRDLREIVYDRTKKDLLLKVRSLH